MTQIYWQIMFMQSNDFMADNDLQDKKFTALEKLLVAGWQCLDK